MISNVCRKCARSFAAKVSRHFCSRNCYYSWKSEDWKMSMPHLEALRLANRTRVYTKKSDEERALISQRTKEAMSSSIVREKLRKKRTSRFSEEEKLAKEKASRVFRGFLRRAVHQRGFSKKSKTRTILGYSAAELRKHLEDLFVEGMSWTNHGSGLGKWHVDHIRPVSSFPTDASPAEVNALSNLQPLWQEENISKGSKWATKQEKP